MKGYIATPDHCHIETDDNTILPHNFYAITSRRKDRLRIPTFVTRTEAEREKTQAGDSRTKMQPFMDQLTRLVRDTSDSLQLQAEAQADQKFGNSIAFFSAVTGAIAFAIPTVIFTLSKFCCGRAIAKKKTVKERTGEESPLTPILKGQRAVSFEGADPLEEIAGDLAEAEKENERLRHALKESEKAKQEVQRASISTFHRANENPVGRGGLGHVPLAGVHPRSWVKPASGYPPPPAHLE